MEFFYILDEKRNVVHVEIDCWAEWFQHRNGREIVGENEVNRYMISTLFLGIDRARFPGDELKVFETIVFDPRGKEIYIERYGSWVDAELGHKAACEKRILACETMK